MQGFPDASCPGKVSHHADMMWIPRLGWATALWTACGLAAAGELPTVTLHMQDRPPYYVPGAPEPSGLAVTPVLAALRSAGLPYRIEQTPALRQLAAIEQGTHLSCGVGWYRSAERAAKGQFSKALYQDLPLAMLTRQSLGWDAPRSMADAVNAPEARLLMKAGYSYGPEFDRLLARRSVPPAYVTGEMAVVARMLAARRADWTPISPEEGQYLLTVTGLDDLRLSPFSDAPRGNFRHLYCNKAVPQDWLNRLNAALPDLKPR